MSRQETAVQRLLVLRRIAVLLALAACTTLAAQAQTVRPKPPPRIPPSPTQNNQIPAGVDTGSPATSDSMPLGTPVPPAPGADDRDVRQRSAAARAAARAKPAAGGASAPKPVGPVAGECAAEAEERRALTACAKLVDRSERAACAVNAVSLRPPRGAGCN